MVKKGVEEIESNEKRKFPIFSVLFLIILVGGLLTIGVLLLKDENQIAQCDTENDCGRYNVNYLKGKGYICANDAIVADSSAKVKTMMFKYASRNAVEDEPSGCSCVNNLCEIKE